MHPSMKKRCAWIRNTIGTCMLEIATGPGLLAKHIAYAAKSVIATDYSEGMIKEARKGVYAKKSFL